MSLKKQVSAWQQTKEVKACKIASYNDNPVYSREYYS